MILSSWTSGEPPRLGSGSGIGSREFLKREDYEAWLTTVADQAAADAFRKQLGAAVKIS